MYCSHLVRAHCWQPDTIALSPFVRSWSGKTGLDRIPSTNPELACSPLNSKTQYAQPSLDKAQMLSNILIEFYSFSLVLIIICLSLPLSRSLLSLLPPSTLYLTSPYHTLSYSYTSCPYLYDYTQTTPFRSPSPVPFSISSLCTLCIPQFKYHLQYSLLWSDPIHVPSLTHFQLIHLRPFSSSMTLMLLSTSPHVWQGPTHVTDTRRCPMPCPNLTEVICT